MTRQPKWGYAMQQFNYTGDVHLETAVCILEFTIPNDISPPILFYYRLTNFYQNHRRYVKSLDTDQLKGKAKTAGQIKSGDCDPLEVNSEGKPYYPCGLIANSMFNDTYNNLTFTNEGERGTTYAMTTKGIAWDTEKDLYGRTNYKPEDVVPPPNWADQYPDHKYTNETGLPDLHTNEAFQVWMRTAGLPTFSKLAMRNDNDVMKAGTYRLKIWDSMLPDHAINLCFLTNSVQDSLYTSMEAQSQYSFLLGL